MDIQKQKAFAAGVSVVSNAILIVLKLAVGFLIQSVSVISEAIHSGVDLIASVIALVAVRHADRPADKEHPFGHGKTENLSGTIEAVLIFVAAGWILNEAIKKIVHQEPVMDSGLGVTVMLISMLANMAVSRYLFRVGKATDSVALEADAWHLRTDVYTSAGVMVGLILILVGERIFPGRHFHWIDPIAAIFVALLIVRAAWDLTMKSAKDLLDRALPHEEAEWMRQRMLGTSPLICGLHHLRTRKAGSHRFVECHLIVKQDATVAESHALTDEIAARIRENFPRTYVTIHVEPCDGACKPVCVSGCILPPEIQKATHASRLATDKARQPSSPA